MDLGGGAGDQRRLERAVIGAKGRGGALSARIAELGRGGKYVEAIPLAHDKLESLEKKYGPFNGDVALNNLALLYADVGRDAEAEPLYKRAIAIQEKNVVQHGAQSSAASAVNKPAVHLAGGSDRLAELVRRDQDLATEADALDKSIIGAVSRKRSKRDVAAESRNRDRLATISAERAGLQETFVAEFLNCAALSNPLPMKAREIQGPLSADEAMELFSVVDNAPARSWSRTGRWIRKPRQS